jgi:16S rRNA (guanine527-N7)-methyltransferase
METSRIADLLAPFLEKSSLTAAQLNQISTYIDLLIRWNSRVNLTAIRTPDEIVTRHFGESLFAARHLFPTPAEPATNPTAPEDTSQPIQSNGRLVDVGSGAGFPGLPIKIWSPKTPLTLIESNNKKVAFLREVIRSLTLTGIDVYRGRAEAFPPASAATVTLRAVEHFDQILPIATRLLLPSGRLALLISQAQLSQARTASPTLQWSTPFPVPHSAQRIIAIAKSVRTEPTKVG